MNSCRICNSFTLPMKRFKCDDGHYFHTTCVVIANFQEITYCEFCVALFLENAKWTNCSSCRKPLTENTPNICPRFNSLCPTCALEKIDLLHVNSCFKCQEYLKSEIKKCDYCNLYFYKKDLQKVPKCFEHSFCKKCLQRSLTPGRKFHSDCAGYFETVNKKNNYSGLCNLCKQTGFRRLSSCSQHKYCGSCLNYIKANDCSEFINITSCNDCCKSEEISKNLIKSYEEYKTDSFQKPLDSYFNEDSKNREVSSKTCRNILQRCDSGHVISENELKEEIFVGKTNCSDCFKLLLKFEGLSKCISCKELNLTPKEERCSMYMNLCKNCYFPQVEITHIRECNKCQNLLYEKIKKCDYCKVLNERNLLFKVPKCSNCVYCRNCLKRTIHYNIEKDFCKRCVGYFRNNEVGIYRDSQCNLCGKYATKSLKNCEFHIYCTDCFSFISSNKESVEFPKISQCHECFQSILITVNVIEPGDYNLESSKTIANPSNFQGLKRCFLQHLHFLKEFTFDGINSSFFDSCKSCEELFLSESMIDFCIYCQKKEIRKIGNRECKKYRNVCEKCFCKRVEPGHVKRCDNCQIISRRSLQNCDKCHESELESFLSRVPRCEEHYFCEECLGKSFRNEREFCEKCVSYFENIGKYHEMGCNVCALAPDRAFPSCKAHRYCIKCYDFITTNDFQKFPNVNSCEDCRTSIVIVKTSISDSQFEVLPKDLYEYNSDFHVSEELHSQYYSFLPQIAEKSIESQNLMNFSEDHQQFFTPVYSNKEPANYQPVHYPNIIAAPLASNQILTNNPMQSPYIPIVPTSNNPFAQILNSPNEETDYSFINNRSNEMDFTPTCSICKKNDSFFAFLCNHNCCKECLVFQCAENIMSFIKEYSVDTSISNTNFQYLCPFKTCRSPISVPTQMIRNEIKQMLEHMEKVSNQMKFREIFQDLTYLNSDNLNSWVPYFDGVKFRLVFK